MDLSDLIDRNAAFSPDKAAIRFAGRTLTYAGFAKRIADAAKALKSQWGVAPGDRVAVLAYNHPDTLVLLYACARLGAMLVPINWRLVAAEHLYILDDASVKALVVEQAFASLVAPLREAHPGIHLAGLDLAPDGGIAFDARRPGGQRRPRLRRALRGPDRHDRAAGRGAADGL